MDIGSPSSLLGRQILIVESEPGLLQALIAGLENDERAEASYITDPYSERGANRLRQFTSDAAIINSAHKGVARVLDVPVLIYGPNTHVPTEVGAIVRALKAMLAGRP